MNERINELSEQCRIETYGINGELLEFGFDEEKFADLIVWECMVICEDVMKKDNSALACWSEIKRTFRS
jgi:hypothetical protein